MTPSGTTRLGAVIGHPIRHSLSPVLYNAAFDAASVDWTFVAFDVPDGGAARALDAMRALGIGWLSVTMPHKQAVARAVDRVSDAAGALDSVNCVVAVDGELVGASTDGDGFLRAVADEVGFVPTDRRCVVFGAGGAARAVVVALAAAGAREVTVVNRTRDRAEHAAALAGSVGRVGSADSIGDADLVVNATSVGMAGGAGEARPPFDVAGLADHTVVADLVYEPAETPLLRAARERELVAVNGLGMLVHQAALQYELVIDGPAPVEAMAAAAAAALAER